MENAYGGVHTCRIQMDDLVVPHFKKAHMAPTKHRLQKD